LRDWEFLYAFDLGWVTTDAIRCDNDPEDFSFLFENLKFVKAYSKAIFI
jgi:hypothetical protein